MCHCPARPGNPATTPKVQRNYKIFNRYFELSRIRRNKLAKAALSLPGLTGQSREFDMTKTYYVYILSSKRNGTLYIGVTNNLERRLNEHRNNLIEGFTNKYNVHHLVYFEDVNDIQSALQREKQLKRWTRKWKLELIEKVNPEWRDLANDFNLE
jgi:putative endonuclease